MAWAPLKFKLRGWGYSSPQSPAARPSPRLPRLSCGCRGCSAGCGATAARLAVSLALISSIVLVAMTFDVSNLEGLLLWVKENKLQGSLLFLVRARERFAGVARLGCGRVAACASCASGAQSVFSCRLGWPAKICNAVATRPFLRALPTKLPPLPARCPPRAPPSAAAVHPGHRAHGAGYGDGDVRWRHLWRAGGGGHRVAG